MDVGRVVRDARRSRGLSQRGLAAAAQVALRSVASAEAEDGRQPSLPVLEALLATCGLELTVAPAVATAPPCRHLHEHLRLSVSQRWAAAAEATGRRADLDQALDAAAARGQLVVEPRAAVPVWVPGTALELPVVVSAHRPWEWPARDGRSVDPNVVVVRPGSPTAPVGLVRVRTGASTDLHVPPPGALATDPCCRPWSAALTAAARLLDDAAALDAGGRRVPAHRQPDEDEEARRLSHALRYTGTARPSVLDSRAYRLGAPASLPQWLHEQGLPPLRGQRRRW